MKDQLELDSLRAKKARLSVAIGKLGFELMVFGVVLFGSLSVYAFLQGSDARRAGYGLLGLTLLIFMVAIWDRWDLNKQPVIKAPKSLDDILEARLLGSFKKGVILTPKKTWEVAISLPQAQFLCTHLLLDYKQIHELLPDDAAGMPLIWQAAEELMSREKAAELHSGILAAALIMSSKDVMAHLIQMNLRIEDVVEVCAWMERLNKYLNERNPYFGGVGRDWAAGFTPTLDRFATNISRQIEMGNAHFHTLAHADILEPIIQNLNSGSVAIVGEAGTGKTSLVYALAQRLLKGQDKSLQYYQIFSLDASAIMSEAKDSLERIVLQLFTEAVRARNVIIFLDDAELFFGTGTGAFDMSKIVQPLLQNQSIRFIAAFTPDEFQQLKSSNAGVAAQLPTVVVTEPSKATTMNILEDTALTLEYKNGILVSYQAVCEAYRLAEEYMQDASYPGKAISLMQQAVPYVDQKFMRAESVQQAVEKTRGLKVSKAEGVEADILLHLEDKIHQRMINQVQAVNAVAAALRRGRAGVSNPNRPIGSFLFLGPTGVGKTELARSLAATYYGSEQQMIRLDMSEYQQESDVARLLDAGGSSTKSLILQIREQPFAVVLLDEIEKAHPNILNLLLQLLDEGQLTDAHGHATSFKNAIIITTSNAGSAEITQKVGAGENLESFERPLIEKLISEGQFKAELINRFDEIVLFRPLNKEELAQVANLMLGEINKTIGDKNITIKLTDAALAKVVDAGYDPQFGARPMRRALQRMVEDSVAKKLLAGEAQPGTTITLDVGDLS